MKIRMASTSDSTSILDIYAFYIQNTAFSFELTIPTVEEYALRIKKYSEEAPWLVAEKEGQIIGFAYASPHRGRAAYRWNREVSIYLKEGFHGKGVAKKLYGVLLQLLKLQGYANALAGITLPNPKSILFHQKMGFQLVGSYKKIGFKDGKWWNVNWYELFLQNEGFKPKQIIPLKKLAALIDFNKAMQLSSLI